MADFCLRCGRPLKNKTSIKRGYGPGCYKKINKDKKKECESKVEIEEKFEIEGQTFLDELREYKDVRKSS